MLDEQLICRRARSPVSRPGTLSLLFIDSICSYRAGYLFGYRAVCIFRVPCNFGCTLSKLPGQAHSMASRSLSTPSVCRAVVNRRGVGRMRPPHHLDGGSHRLTGEAGELQALCPSRKICERTLFTAALMSL